MQKQLIAVLILSILSLVSGKHTLGCKFGQFYDKISKSCLTCTKCQGFNIIRKPCKVYRDTVCGPFDEFDGSFLQNSNFLKSKPKSQSPVSNVKGSSTLSTPDTSAEEFISDEGWYTISMVLLVVLCLLSTGIALYIVFACFVCKKSEDKEIMYQPEFINRSNADDDTPRYVETYIPSRDRLKSHPSVMSRVYVNDITSLSPLLLPASEKNIYINCSNIETEDSRSSNSSGYVYLQTTY